MATGLVRRALISVSDKTGVVEFARELQGQFEFMLVSTGGTERILKEAKLSVLPVQSFTNFPEMMDGRLKTLHPKVHGGILARRGSADDMKTAEDYGIPMWDVVCVNLYPFARTAEKPNVRFEELIEQIDIGGPTMIRGAVKNFRDVLVLVNPRWYNPALEQLALPEGPTLDFRFALMREAIRHTADYDDKIASVMAEFAISGGEFYRYAEIY